VIFEEAMAANREEELYPANDRDSGDNALTRAQAALTEVLTELSRLTQDPLFARVDDVATALADLPAGSQIYLDAVHRLRDLSAGHQRVAVELEAAARCCRLVEREMSKRVDVLLTGWNEEISVTLGNKGAKRKIEKRRIGRDGWFSERFHRIRSDSRHSGNSPPPVMPRYELTPATLAAEFPAPGPDPGSVIPQADIAALALGPLEVHVAGHPVPRWNSMKARAVFQYLLIHQGRPTRRDVLMALQWPDHSRNSARNNLNVALYSLRNILGPNHVAQPILYRDGCYILNPELNWWIDRNEFLSALDDARLAGRTGRPGKVKDLYGEAIERVTEIHFQLGELPEALHFGQLGLRNDPCSEAIHRLLMRCHASRREQQLVSRQYQACTAALRAELGISPSEETTRLLHELI
jgi:DNA-binding SARP family transcriptional activator